VASGPVRLQFGTYETPRFNFGDIVRDERRGDVEIVRLSNAKIPWPIGRPQEKGRRRQHALVLYDALVEAVRKESNLAVADAWGVTGQTVTLWRKALGVDSSNDGSRLLWRERGFDRIHDALPLAWQKAADETRREKIRQAKLGKPRPRSVVEKMRTARLGRKTTDETRRRQSEAHRRRGTRPPAAGRAWTAREDKLCRELAVAEVVKRTGRTLAAVYVRRHVLGLPDGRSK